MRVLGDVAAGTCALLFMAAALGKLDSWAQWSRLSEEIPGRRVVGRLVRVAIPATESAIVVLSFAVPVVGLAAGAALLVILGIAVWFLAGRLAGSECNCFGAIAPATISRRLAVRNIALAFLAVAGWFAAQHESLKALSLSGVLLTIVVGAIALMMFQFGRLRHAALPTSRMAKEVE